MRCTCDRCGEPFDVSGVGRIRHYCSDACRQAAYRDRKGLPPEMLAAPRWVRHISKRPVTVSGCPASSTDPRTWSTYQSVVLSTVGDGIGFVLGDGIACIDIDHCIEDGKPNALAREMLARFPGSYVEVSPSGTGLHLWGRASERKGVRREYEAYSVGRYITITGDVFRRGGLVDISSAFE